MTMKIKGYLKMKLPSLFLAIFILKCCLIQGREKHMKLYMQCVAMWNKHGVW